MRPFRGTGRVVRVSPAGGERAEWQPDGKELFYLTGDQTLMAVQVGDGPDGLTFSAPEKLFTVRTGGDLGRRQFAAGADGRRFLLNARVEESGPPSLHVLFNWPALLGR
ncbi:MAG TPA: hypothetical protein PKE47_00780 [Verrucomicrobiota bacterium]|nr:hypothetical protein [Verrucomicrobiota bacterium]